MTASSASPERRRIVHASFEDVASRQPDRIAVECDGRGVSYRDLNARANTLAHLLIELGAAPETIVAVFMESTPEYVSAILGIMKSGAVFMPLDVETPPERFKLLVGKARPRFVIAAMETRNRLEELIAGAGLEDALPIITIDPDFNLAFGNTERPADLVMTDPPLRSAPDDPLYVVSTSGSTGRPKMILGMQKSLAHFIHWELKEFGLGESTRISQIPPVTFDASFRDIFSSLLAGGTVCIPSRPIRSSSTRLLEWIEQSRITLVHCVPSVFRMLMKEAESMPPRTFFPELRHVLLAGEPFYGRDVLRWLDLVGDRVELVNLYGPSETTLVKLFQRIRERPQDPGRMIPVGQPMPNTAVLIVKSNRLCRIGEIGEIFIKTPFMSKGYLGDPELTAKSFVQNPLVTEPDTVYRTGDLGRYLPDRSVEFIGRTDSQVKVDGNRVELGEIEACLLNHPSILQAVVTLVRVAEDSDRLACYFTVKSPVEPADLKDHLARHLPSYMIPSYYIRMDSFPQTITGKIDRKALPPPETMSDTADDVAMPETEVELKIAAIWGEILNRPRIGLDALYFQVGGTSLKAIQIIARLYRTFSLEIAITDFLREKTIRKLAAFIQSPQARHGEAIASTPVADHYALSLAQRRLWVQCHLEADKAAFNMAGAYEIEGSIDVEALEKAYTLLIRRHESLRTSFAFIEGEPRQRVSDAAAFRIEIVTLSPDEDPEALVNRLTAREAGTPFDLARAPLLRAVLIRLASDRHVLINTMHHLVSDGWSLRVFGREILAAYNAFVRRVEPDLPTLTVQYRDFASWQRERQESAVMLAHRDYWRHKLAGELRPLDLPYDLPRPPRQTFRGRILRTAFDAELLRGISELARVRNVSLFTLLLSCLKVLLHRITSQEEIIVGSAVSGRDHPDLENQVGFYVNLLAIRDRLGGAQSFDEVISGVGASMAEALAHQEYPFDRLVEDLQLGRDLSRPIVYNVAMDFDQESGIPVSMEGARIRELEVDWNTSNLDLLFYFHRDEESLRLEINYNTDLFHRETVERMAGHLREIMVGCLANSATPLRDLPINLAGNKKLITGQMEGPRPRGPSTIGPRGRGPSIASMEAASLDLTDNPVARLIAAAWRTVLGRDSLDANENFFELGGDSIKAIQIVTRLAEAGIRLEVADLFESPTVAQLASRLRTGGSSIGRAPIPEGPIPLTPIQTWFARAHADHLHHFNMGVLFRGRIRLDQGAVEEVIKAIIAHHDALRMTYRIEEGRLVQETTAHADAFELDILRIEPEETVLAKVASWATRAGTSFDLASGPLVRAGLFTSENGDHLALLFHHILVDAVSMRFLIEDFAAAYEQRMRGESIRLVEKTDPFAAWAHALQRHATSDELLRELPYWTSVVASGRDLPRRAESAEKSLVTDGVTIKESFDEAATTRFTTSMNRLFKARTDEVLLAALALALSRWSGASRTLLFMEGHGREPISEPVDLTRTVGWFTTVFPVVLEASPGVGLADLVHRARDHLRRIPTRGLGFGVLKYLTPPDLLRGADLAIRGDLLFNYLGQIDQESDGIIEIIDAPLGVMAPTTSMEYPMTLEAMIFEGRLEFVLTVDPAVYSPDEARDLLAHLRVALEEILAHDEVPRPAPSDLTFAGLTSEELDRVITDI